MKNIGKTLLSPVCALAMVANSVSGAMAQDKRGDKQAVAVQSGVEIAAAVNVLVKEELYSRIQEIINRRFANAGQQGGDSVFQFFSQEMSFDSRLVTGAPFSADIVSETIQVLPDGNRIVQRSEGRIYRDSQGRTRSERTYQMGGSNERKQVINIRDPISRSSYSLDPETRIARKNAYYFASQGMSPATPPQFFTLPFNPNAPSEQRSGVPIRSSSLASSATDAQGQPRKINVSGGVLQGAAIRRIQPSYPAVARAARASGAVQVHITVSETGEVMEASAIDGHPLLRDAAVEAARQWLFKPTKLSGEPVKVQGVLTFNFMLSDESPAPAQTASRVSKYPPNAEKLGKQMIEGVECEGVRAVTTLPEGAIGNERPIETVSETWHSPELQMTILSKRSDPRFGESTYRVINIVRSEPDAALFQVPQDYAIIDSRARKVEVDVKEFEELRRKVEEAQKKSQGTRKPNN